MRIEANRVIPSPGDAGLARYRREWGTEIYLKTSVDFGTGFGADFVALRGTETLLVIPGPLRGPG